jgi:predicted metallopeptidase
VVASDEDSLTASSVGVDLISAAREGLERMRLLFERSSGPFNFTTAMRRLCLDIVARLPELSHIDMDRVAVCFAQTRSKALHGLQAKLTPLRFEHGSRETVRGGRVWTVQRLVIDQREMLYILTFYLPRFLDQSFREKFITVVHELYHISPSFNGDIRRLDGRCHVHSHSQKAYDREMARLAQQYLAQQPPVELFEFLRYDFKTLHHHWGGVVGLQTPIPKLLPVRNSQTA